MADPVKAPGQIELERLREGGFTPEEMGKWTLDTRAKLKAGGFSDDEIELNYFGNRLTSNPRPIMQLGQNRLEGSEKAPKTMTEAFEVGFGWGGSNLGAQATTGGALPDRQITPDLPWHLRLAGNVGTLVGDLPLLMAGGRVGGAPAAFMLTGVMRHLFIDALENGEIKTKEEFVDLLVSTGWEAAKGWVTGQTMNFAGRAAAVTSKGAPAIVKLGVPAAAEAAALVTVSRGLEGELPTPNDFVDMGLIVFGFKGAMAGGKKLRNIWAKTGITPKQIGEDIKVEPKVWQELLSDKEIPSRYANLAENGSLAPRNRFGTNWWNSTVLPRLKDAIMGAEGDAPRLVVLNAPEAEAIKGAMDPAPAAVRPNRRGEPRVDTLPEPKSVTESRMDTVPEPKPDVEPKVTEPSKTPKDPQKEPLDADAEARAKAYFERPFTDIPRGPDEPARPQNLTYTDTSEAVKQSIHKLSEQFAPQILAQRRGVVPNKESYTAAKKVLDEMLGLKTPASPEEALSLKTGDYTKLTADIYARKELATRAAEDLLRRRQLLVAKGANVTDVDRLTWIAEVEKTGRLLADFAGTKAEVGRALQVLQMMKKLDGAKQLEAVKNLLDEYGGAKNLDKLNKALDELQDPHKVLDYARRASKATNWDMFMEAYRASLISGTTTAEVNLISTAAFTGGRIPIRAVAAGFGAFHGGDKVVLSESLGHSVGILMGTKHAAIVTAAVVKHGLQTARDAGPIAAGRELLATVEKGAESVTGKAYDGGRRNAIPGALGHGVRAPFLALSLPDLYLKTVNTTAELYALAHRNASIKEGHMYGTKAHDQAVVDFVNNPPPEALAASEAAGLRFSLNAPAGPMSAALGHFLEKWYVAQVAIPFRRIIGNLFKEGARMTPGLNLTVGEWRADFAAGGARRDMALAEVTVGGLVMLGAYMAAQEGTLTGAGSPDRGQKPVDRDAGWAPYAVKIEDKYVTGYQRMAPYGQLMGMAADAYEIKQYMTQDEHNQLLRMIGVAIAKNVTNPSFMQGAVGVANVASDPAQYGENYLEQLAGSMVPSFFGQMAREQDPLLREIEGVFEAIQARIPGWREGLRPKISYFGEKIKNPEHLWYGSPFVVTQVSGDKVRLEASRIGFAAAPTPKDVSAYTGIKGEKSLNSIKLTAAQRDIFAIESGQLAHKVLMQFVHAPGWDASPDIYKKQVYHNVFQASREYASMKALDPSERTESETDVIRRIIQELQ